MLMTEEQLFASAIEIACEDDRAAFVQQACGDDQDLRDKLSHLLKMHFSSGRLLDETRDISVHETIFAATPNVGDTIGSYKLLQEIGDGGMGVVFMAEQLQPVQRKVAVKVIKLGMDTRRVIARFESERQALALMDHPCITRVLDAGCTESGRPYFVMDLVRGKSITEFCDEKKIPLKQRLNIFVQVCGAVEHAHQKGIIHRDIKPSNIMVTSNDGVPLPKIIDFGIAKAIDQRLTEKTLFTNYGEMIGTPLYMSPEQAEMSEPDVDTRSDVYSLGVLLYELVTGSTPFDDLKEQGFYEIRQAIRSTDPVFASTRISKLGETVGQISENRNTDIQTLQRFVRGELDWILAKCLARDRSQRYQSAGELAREIGRYLNGEVVEAAKPSLSYRTQKFVSKHKSAVAMAAAIALILCSSTIVSVAMAMKARDSEQLANSRLQQVEAERDRAQKAEQQLALMEREQRNQAAINQGIAMHNANMLKNHMKLATHAPNQQANIYVKPVSALWNASTPAAPTPPTSFQGQRSRKIGIVQRPEGTGQLRFMGNQECENIEVVVLSDEASSKVELLECIVGEQRKRFGPDNVWVAATLNQLGDIKAGQQKWEESEKYFREAIEIIEEMSDVDREVLSEMRLNIIGCMKQRGDVKRAMAELKKYQLEFEEAQITDRIKLFIDNLNLDEFEIEVDASDEKND